MHHPTDRVTHTTAFVTPVVEHWLEREIAQWVIFLGQNIQPEMYIYERERERKRERERERERDANISVNQNVLYITH